MNIKEGEHIDFITDEMREQLKDVDISVAPPLSKNYKSISYIKHKLRWNNEVHVKPMIYTLKTKIRRMLSHITALYDTLTRSIRGGETYE